MSIPSLFKTTLAGFALILTPLLSTQAMAQSPLFVATGLSVSALNETIHATDSGKASTIEVKNLVAPFLRIGYALSPSMRMDVTGSFDIYGGTFNVSDNTAPGRESVVGLRLAAGPTWLGPKIDGSLGTYRPLVHAGVSYGGIKNGLNFPITSFKDAWGVELACGMSFERMELRLKGAWAKHDARSRRAGYEPAKSDDALDLLQVGVEISIHSGQTL